SGPALCVELASGHRRSVLGGVELNGELPWLAAALRDRAGAVEHERSEPDQRHDLLLEIDSHLVEQGGRVTTPVAGPGGWQTVELVLPPGLAAGDRLRLRGLGPDRRDLFIRLRMCEADERAGTIDGALHW